jgi:hypothetical protein
MKKTQKEVFNFVPINEPRYSTSPEGYKSFEVITYHNLRFNCCWDLLERMSAMNS